MPDGEVDSDEEPGETESAQSRYWLTNDIAAILMTVTMGFLVVASVTTAVEVPDIVVQAFVAGFLVAVVWLFGKGASKMIFGEGR